jgi:hypothetical protein
VNHYTSPAFWKYFDALPPRIRLAANKNFKLLKKNPRHPSLHFKPVGKLWSVRVTADFRALGNSVDDGILWFWIGPHKDYDSMI